MNQKEQKLLKAISQLANCNPFSPQRFALEKDILGNECEPMDSIAWNRRSEQAEGERPNVVRLTEMASALVQKVEASSAGGDFLPEDLRQDYRDVATYVLLYRYITELPATEFWSSTQKNRARLARAWKRFYDDYRKIFDVNQGFPLDEKSAGHLFACLCQVHRAFFNIFDYILGGSLPISQLRQKVWESIFTCNPDRYHQFLYNRMRDLSTLISGPSGTGKELVARAIGLSQYVPFDTAACQFQIDPSTIFLPLNLSALSPTLIESELFGHHRGAFTGAIADRSGWLESCSRHGAVFLDEIGDLDLGLQVKLLRVVQQRTYCRIGEAKQRCFEGKIITATNRDLSDEISAGRFREDFYYRLCTDRIQTPSLREQLDDSPDDLQWLVNSIARNHLDAACDQLSDEISGWIRSNLGDDYRWPGNMRELEQCVASYLIRQDYVPAEYQSHERESFPVWLETADGEMTAEQLLSRYCTWLYSQHGSYEKTAQILNIDRRTVKSKIDSSLLTDFTD